MTETTMTGRAAISTAFLLGVIGPEVFIVQPGFVQGLVELLGYSAEQAGQCASVEMFGIAATTVLMTFSAHRFNWRLVVAFSLILMFAANALSTLVQDMQAFMALRFAAGLGAGALVSLSFAAVGLTADPDRNFGLLIMWVLIYGALGLWLMPSAYELAGMNGVLWFFAVFPLIALPFLRYFPRSGENVVQVDSQATNLPVQQKALALLAMFAYFLAQGVVWAYLFLIGQAGGLTEQSVANGLMLSQVAGIAGAALAAVLGNRYGRSRPLMLSILGGAACLYFLTGSFSFLLFAVVVSIYNFFWNLTHPFLLASMASFDLRGRVVVYAVAMQMLGLAVGPFLASRFVSDTSFVNVNIIGGALFVFSLLLILPPVLMQQRAVRENA